MPAFEMVGNKLLLSGDLQPRRLKAVTEPCDRQIFSVTSQNRFPVVIRVFVTFTFAACQPAAHPP